MDKNRWLEWARELQNLSQCALAYCKDRFDIERFERIREISAEMMQEITDLPIEQVRELFCGDEGYQTPKIETRAAVFCADRILLVQERNGLWSLPGGWVDYNLSVGENAVKEVLEEAGMNVRATRLIALRDHNRHHIRKCPYEVCSALVLCEYLSGRFVPNIETIDAGFFPLDGPPTLEEGKTNPAQIELSFKAAADPNWATLFD